MAFDDEDRNNEEEFPSAIARRYRVAPPTLPSGNGAPMPKFPGVPFRLPEDQQQQPDNPTPPQIAMPQQTMPNMSTPAPMPPVNPHTKEIARLESTGSGVSQIQNPFLHGLAKVGDVIGSIAAPRIAAQIPGTTLHHEQLLGQQEGLLNQDYKREQEQAQTAATQAEVPLRQAQTKSTEAEVPLHEAETERTQAQTAALENPPLKDIEQFHTLPDGTIVELNRDANGNTTAHAVYQGNPKVETEIINKAIGGEPHNVIINKLTGEIIQDLGRKGHEPPNTVINDRSEIQHGRTLLDKAEQQYQKSSEKADALSDMIVMAQHGNKVAAAAQPLEGTLALVTSQGVTRINRNELEGIAGAGSLFDRLSGKVGKLTEGQPIPPDVQQGFVELAQKLKENSYKTYRANHTSAVKRYNLQNEEPLPAPTVSAGGGGGGTQDFVDNGKTYHIPVEHVAEFKKDHPNAR